MESIPQNYEDKLKLLSEFNQECLYTFIMKLVEDIFKIKIFVRLFNSDSQQQLCDINFQHKEEEIINQSEGYIELYYDQGRKIFGKQVNQMDGYESLIKSIQQSSVQNEKGQQMDVCELSNFREGKSNNLEQQLKQHYQDYRQYYDPEINQIMLARQQLGIQMDIKKVKEITEELKNKVKDTKIIDFLQEQLCQQGQLLLGDFLKIIKFNMIPVEEFEKIQDYENFLSQLQSDGHIKQVKSSNKKKQKYWRILPNSDIQELKDDPVFNKYYTNQKTFIDAYEQNLLLSEEELVKESEVIRCQLLQNSTIKQLLSIQEIIDYSLTEEAQQFSNELKNINEKSTVYLFIGRTKVGKSSVINSLLGFKSELVTTNNIQKLQFKQNDLTQSAIVGNKASSCTKYPKFIKVKNYPQQYYCDTCGLGDNRQGHVQVCNQLILKELFQLNTNITIIYVIDGDCYNFSNPGIDFSNDFKFLQQILGQQEMQKLLQESKNECKKDILFLFNKGNDSAFDNFKEYIQNIDVQFNTDTQNFLELMDENVNLMHIKLYGDESQNSIELLKEQLPVFKKHKRLDIGLTGNEKYELEQFYKLTSTKISSLLKNHFIKIIEMYGGDSDDNDENVSNKQIQLIEQIRGLGNTITTLQNMQKLMQQATDLGVLYDLNEKFIKEHSVALSSTTQCADSDQLLQLLKALKLVKPVISQQLTDDLYQEQTIWWQQLNDQANYLCKNYIDQLGKQLWNQLDQNFEKLSQELNKNNEDNEDNEDNENRVKSIEMAGRFKKIVNNFMELLPSPSQLSNAMNNQSGAIYEFIDIILPIEIEGDNQMHTFLKDILKCCEALQFTVYVGMEDQYKQLYSNINHRAEHFQAALNYYTSLNEDCREKIIKEHQQYLQKQRQENQIQSISIGFIKHITKFIPAAYKLEKMLGGQRLFQQFLIKAIGKTGKQSIKKLGIVGSVIGFKEGYQQIRWGSKKSGILHLLSSAIALVPGALPISVILDFTNIIHQGIKDIEEQTKQNQLLKYLNEKLAIRDFQRFITKPTKKKLILSIDGGGIRGIIPAIMLSYIERKYNFCIQQFADMYAGTSTGSIIVSILSMKNKNNQAPKYRAKQVAELYIQQRFAIFKPHNIFNVKGQFQNKYSNSGLQKITKQYFQDEKLNNLSKPILIPTSRTRQNELPECHCFTQDDDNFLYDAVIASSSAPTFFPSYQIGEYQYVDGGLLNNNPSVLAYEAFKKQLQDNEDHIYILSLGTGCYNDSQAEDGILYWATKGLGYSIAQSMQDVDKKLKDLSSDPNSKLYNGYFRLQPPLKQKISIDTTEMDCIQEMVDITIQYLEGEEGKKEVERFISTFLQ